MNRLLSLLFIIPFLFSCDKNDDKAPKNNAIVFKFSQNAQPTGTNNLIGVQIYVGTKASGMDQYAPFAYGLFDDFSKIKIDLPEGFTYIVKSSVVVDGKTKIAQDGNGYLKPFVVQNKGVALTNSFTLSSDKAMTLLNNSTSTLIDKPTLPRTKESPVNGSGTPKDFAVPNLDRYYGESEVYNPDSPDAVEVDLTRQVFGIRMNVEFVGSEIEPEDCLYMAVTGAPDTLFIYAKNGRSQTIEAMYTFSDFEAQEASNGYVRLNIYYRDKFGEDMLMRGASSGAFLFRNDLTILNHQVVREGSWLFPYNWDAINGFYGDRGI